MPSRMMTSITARMDSSVSSSSFLDCFLTRMATRIGTRIPAADVQIMLVLKSSSGGSVLASQDCLKTCTYDPHDIRPET